MVLVIKKTTINDLYNILHKIIHNNDIDDYKISFNTLNSLYAAYNGLDYTINSIINNKNYILNCNKITDKSKVYNIDKNNIYIMNINVYIDNMNLHIISNKIYKVIDDIFDENINDDIEKCLYNYM